MTGDWTGIFKGAGGGYEVNRFVGAIGVLTYVISVPLFVAWEVCVKGREFDLVAFCAAYPGGLIVAMGAVAGAVAIKDRQVAKAKVEAEGGA